MYFYAVELFPVPKAYYIPTLWIINPIIFHYITAQWIQVTSDTSKYINRSSCISKTIHIEPNESNVAVDTCLKYPYACACLGQQLCYVTQ